MKTHAEWAQSVKRASEKADKAAAAQDLEQIAREVGDAEEAGFSPWHLVQTLSLAAMFFEEAKKPAEAERVLRDCLGVTHDQLVQASRAHAEVAARLGALLLQGGSNEEGQNIGAQALQALAMAPEPSLALEQFLAVWRKNATARPGAV